MDGHVILLGDSIFDNAAYVPGGPAVIEHLRRGLPEGWKATLLGVDGSLATGSSLAVVFAPTTGSFFSHSFSRILLSAIARTSFASMSSAGYRHA